MKLHQAQIDANASIAHAQHELDAAYHTWQTYSDRIHKNLDDFLVDYNQHIKALEHDISDATRNVADARTNLYDVRRLWAQKIQNARDDLTRAKSSWHTDVQNAQNAVNDAQRKVDAEFGDALKAIRGAQDNVDSLQCMTSFLTKFYSLLLTVL